jgi:paraquat-inducible protein A
MFTKPLSNDKANKSVNVKNTVKKNDPFSGDLAQQKTLLTVHCEQCGLTVNLPSLSPNQKAICPRCAHQLLVNYANAFDRVLAFAISALIFLVIALSFDFVSLQFQGQIRTISLLDTYFVLSEQGYMVIGAILIFTVVVLPFIVIMALFYLLFSLRKQRYPFKGELVAQWVLALLPWSMAEIFLIGVLVSLIKISTMATVTVGLSFYAYILFSLCFIAAIQYIDKQHLQLSLLSFRKSPIKKKQKKILVKTQMSIQKTWALLLTAIILYIPANLLPIMITKSLGKEELNTILGGVIVLWQAGSYPIAIIIFIASIVVPILKFIILAWLNYSVQKQNTTFKKQRIMLYRLTEFIGRWSMIDVFAVAILASLIQLGTTMTIYPGYAALAFTAVVILTMFAAHTFDSTLIWKSNERNK